MVMRKDLTSKEKNKIIDKGRRWLLNYLGNMAKPEMDPDVKRKLFNVMAAKYKELMKCDAEFFDDVYGFVSERRTSSEKNKFYGVLVGILVSHNLREDLAEKYPEVYTMPTPEE